MTAFPKTRLRRYRQTANIRKMLDTPLPGPEKFIWPTFVVEGTKVREPIESMPGQYRLSIDELISDLKRLEADGIGGVLLFGIAKEDEKDPNGSYAFDPNGTVQKAITAIKKSLPDFTVISDVCLCAYTDHGHCGQLDSKHNVDNDASIELLAKIALSHAVAGADIVAPSAMMDGQVHAIRTALDDNGFEDTIIMSYSTKFTSSMYGPFRDAEQSAPGKGDRKGYQASYASERLALLESDLDEEEGADILMVKPGIFYLDMLAKLRERTDLPIAVYNVSGEYSMLIATADRGWGNIKEMVRESTAAFSRAGADIIISYWANHYKEIFTNE